MATSRSALVSRVMFIAVMSTRASLDNTIAVQAQEYGYDVIVWLERALRATQLIGATQNVEGVERVARIVRAMKEFSILSMPWN